MCRDVRSAWPEIVCIMLTSYPDDEALFAAVMAGAAGYLLKQVGSIDLVDAIRRAASGASLLDPVMTERVLERVRQGPHEDPRLAALTRQERRDSRPDRPGSHEPPDRRGHVPLGEDGQELRLEHARQAGDGAAHAGRDLRRATRGALKSRHATRRHRDLGAHGVQAMRRRLERLISDRERLISDRVRPLASSLAARRWRETQHPAATSGCRRRRDDLARHACASGATNRSEDPKIRRSEGRRAVGRAPLCHDGDEF